MSILFFFDLSAILVGRGIEVGYCHCVLYLWDCFGDYAFVRQWKTSPPSLL